MPGVSNAMFQRESRDLFDPAVSAIRLRTRLGRRRSRPNLIIQVDRISKNK